jgi:integrase
MHEPVGLASLGKRMVPARVRREPSVLSAAQVTQLLDATRDDPHHALWAVLTLTGLRPSEALALRWSDVNLDRGELRVMRKLRRPKNGTAWVIEDCKTDKSRRVVPLVPVAVDTRTLEHGAHRRHLLARHPGVQAAGGSRAPHWRDSGSPGGTRPVVCPLRSPLLLARRRCLRNSAPPIGQALLGSR